MKNVSQKSVFFSLLVSIIFLGFTSCEDKEEQWGEEKANRHINAWINGNMSAYYYWSNAMPANIDSNVSPEDYFESLLYKRNTRDGDRFSWIQDNYVELINSLNGVASSDIGFEIGLASNMKNTYNLEVSYLATILYVKKNSDAERKGLKRGMLIATVNGNNITQSNVASLFTSRSTMELEIIIPGPNGQIQETKQVSVTPNLNYADNPIYLDSIYNVGSKKIGYVVYNFFAADKGDKTNTYDINLMRIFDRFSNSGVNNLVLDLRYNLGGSVLSANYIASALMKNRTQEKVFVSYKYNDGLTAYLKREDMNDWFEDKFKDFVKATTDYSIPRLGDKLEKVYVITGNYTASASEAVINGLKPYLGDRLVLIGATTYGKNVGSITIYDEKDPHNKWGMQPIITKIANADGFSEYQDGFTPDYRVNEFVFPLFALGDENEVLLKETINLITGRSNIKSVLTQTDVNQSCMINSSLSHKGYAYQTILNHKNKDNLNLVR